jgi:dCTP deaminase
MLVDAEIRMACQGDPPLITPFVEGGSLEGISHGLTSAGYDIRLGNTLWCMEPSSVPLQLHAYESPTGFNVATYPLESRVLLQPHSYYLGYSLEYIYMPNDLKGRCIGKSTWARLGLLVNTTPLEPGWEGQITLELVNLSPRPLAVLIGGGIAQLEFERLSQPVERPYRGKYQCQIGVVPALKKEV